MAFGCNRRSDKRIFHTRGFLHQNADFWISRSGNSDSDVHIQTQVSGTEHDFRSLLVPLALSRPRFSNRRAVHPDFPIDSL